MTAFVKSVEYLEITLTGSTAVDADLTKGQAIDDCVPFFTVNLTSDVDDFLDHRYAEVYFTSGSPNKVTALRGAATGTVVVGVFVVEFDTSGDITVHLGHFVLIGGSEVFTTEAIDPVTVTKAFCVISYRSGADNDDWDRGQIALTFNSGTELAFDRRSGEVAGSIDGRYYVVATAGTDFSVIHQQVTLANQVEENNEEISAITLASTFVYTTYLSNEGNDDTRDGGIVVDLEDTTHVRARRAFNSFGSGPGAAGTTSGTAAAQIVSAGGSEFSVERAECDWGDSLTAAVSVTEIDQTKAIVVPGGYQGVMNADEVDGPAVDGNYAILDFSSDTEVTGTRGTNTAPDGTTFFEVVEFELSGAPPPALRSLALLGVGQ